MPHDNISLHEIRPQPSDKAGVKKWEKEMAKWFQPPAIMVTADDGQGNYMKTAHRLSYCTRLEGPDVETWLGRIVAEVGRDWKHVHVWSEPGIPMPETKSAR